MGDQFVILSENFKELSQLYKLKAQQKVGAHCAKKEPPKMMMVILGGMIYDQELGRGIRKKYLPEPNPAKVEISRDACYTDLLEVAKSRYFMEFEPELDNLGLADSIGMPIAVANPEKWTLGSFYSRNSLQPSRYKLRENYPVAVLSNLSKLQVLSRQKHHQRRLKSHLLNLLKQRL